jgi:hypothetical protein
MPHPKDVFSLCFRCEAITPHAYLGTAICDGRDFLVSAGLIEGHTFRCAVCAKTSVSPGVWRPDLGPEELGWVTERREDRDTTPAPPVVEEA